MINLYDLLKRAFGHTAASLKPFRIAGGQRGASKTWRNTGRPNAARHWHDPTDAVHLDRMQQAELRRERRAEKNHICHKTAWKNNQAIHGSFCKWDDLILLSHVEPLNLNPFYVAK